jgi:hypothetical protein
MKVSWLRLRCPGIYSGYLNTKTVGPIHVFYVYKRGNRKWRLRYRPNNTEWDCSTLAECKAIAEKFMGGLS